MAAKTKTTNGKTKTTKKAKKAVKAKSAGAPKAEGYKGKHRAGTMKETLHKLFDADKSKDKEKARAAALKLKGADGKLIAPATVNTSFSQFRTGAL